MRKAAAMRSTTTCTRRLAGAIWDRMAVEATLTFVDVVRQKSCRGAPEPGQPPAAGTASRLSGCTTRNAASARVVKKLGFVREGTVREDCIVNGEMSDAWVYGLIRRQWLPSPEPVPAR